MNMASHRSLELPVESPEKFLALRTPVLWYLNVSELLHARPQNTSGCPANCNDLERCLFNSNLELLMTLFLRGSRLMVPNCKSYALASSRLFRLGICRMNNPTS